MGDVSRRDALRGIGVSVTALAAGAVLPSLLHEGDAFAA
jgi:hypothetical protein